MRFLVNSGNLVAQGDNDEAVRLAVALRVLLHDTRSSHSLLSQLGWKDRLAYVDSLRELEVVPGVILSLGTESGETVGHTYGLVVLVDDQAGGVRYAAPLDREPVGATLPFEKWWTDKSFTPRARRRSPVGTWSTRWLTTMVARTSILEGSLGTTRLSSCEVPA